MVLLDVDTEMLRSIRTALLFYQSATICYFISVLIALSKLFIVADTRTTGMLLYATLYKLYTMNRAVICIYISLPFTIFYDIRCSQFYLWIRARICSSNKLQRSIYHLIIVSTFYFISQKENIDKMYLTTVTVVLVKQEARLLSPSFCTIYLATSLFKRRIQLIDLANCEKVHEFNIHCHVGLLEYTTFRS